MKTFVDAAFSNRPDIVLPDGSLKPDAMDWKPTDEESHVLQILGKSGQDILKDVAAKFKTAYAAEKVRKESDGGVVRSRRKLKMIEIPIGVDVEGKSVTVKYRGMKFKYAKIELAR